MHGSIYALFLPFAPSRRIAFLGAYFPIRFGLSQRCGLVFGGCTRQIVRYFGIFVPDLRSTMDVPLRNHNLRNINSKCWPDDGQSSFSELDFGGASCT